MVSNATATPVNASISTPVCATVRATHFTSSADPARRDLDFDVAQIQIVTERDQLRRLLRRLNPGDARSREDVPLPDLILGNQLERFLPQLNLAGGDRFPRALFLRGNVNHLRAAIVRQMGQSIHL